MLWGRLGWTVTQQLRGALNFLGKYHTLANYGCLFSCNLFKLSIHIIEKDPFLHKIGGEMCLKCNWYKSKLLETCMVHDLKHGAETLLQALAGTEDHITRVGVGVSQKEEPNTKIICLVLKWYWGKHSKCQPLPNCV